MPQFRYTAQNSAGKVITGIIDAADRVGALQTLAHQNAKPISVEAAKKSGTIDLNFLKNRVKSTDLVIFTRQLSTMVSAGVPLLRAISTLQKQSDSKTMQQALEAVTKDVQGGMPLGDAFAKHPKIFNDVYVNMVRAGEAGGILDDILKRLAMQQEKNDSMRKKVKSAMTYPAILMIITVGAFFGLMIFVIPQIGGILHELGGPDAKLPAITVAMLAISDFMRQFWYICLGLIGAGIYLFRRWLHTKRGRSLFHHAVLRVPAIGTIVTKVAVARFARTYASLIGAGVNILEALRVTGEAIGNEAFRETLQQAIDDVKGGQPLSLSLERQQLFPAIIPQMLAVGEETGQTDQVLIKVADFYEEEVDTAIQGISSVIEPVMIVIMGSVVGLIAVSVMGPIASLSQNIKG